MTYPTHGKIVEFPKQDTKDTSAKSFGEGFSEKRCEKCNTLFLPFGEHHTLCLDCYRQSIPAIPVEEPERSSIRERDVFVGAPLDLIILREYANRIDKLCCVKCSNTRCRKRDGHCWVWDDE
jgi:hypothetical protein